MISCRLSAISFRFFRRLPSRAPSIALLPYAGDENGPLEGRGTHSPLLNCSSNVDLRVQEAVAEIGGWESRKRTRTVFLPSLAFIAYGTLVGISWPGVALSGIGPVAAILLLGLRSP